MEAALVEITLKDIRGDDSSAVAAVTGVVVVVPFV